MIKDAEKKAYFNNFPTADDKFFNQIDKLKQAVTTDIYEELGMENEDILPLMSSNTIDLYNQVKQKTKLVVRLDGSNSFDYGKNEITISLSEVKALSQLSGISAINILEQSFRHELRHALSHYGLENDSNNEYTTKLLNLFDLAAKNIPDSFYDTIRGGFRFSNNLPYGLQYDKSGAPNLHEFLAEAFENDDFRKYLKSAYIGGNNLWQKLLQLINKFIKIPSVTTIYDQITEIYNSKSFTENNDLENINNVGDMFLSYHYMNNVNNKTFYEKIEDDLISLNVAEHLKKDLQKFINGNKALRNAFRNETDVENEAMAVSLQFSGNESKYADKLAYLLRDMVSVSEVVSNMESTLRRQLEELKNKPNSYNEQLVLIGKAKLKLDSLSEFFDYLNDVRTNIIKDSPSKSLKSLLDSTKLTGEETPEEKKEKEQKAVTMTAFIRLLEYPISYKEFLEKLLSSEIKAPIIGVLKQGVKPKHAQDLENEINDLKNKLSDPNKTDKVKSFLIKKIAEKQKLLDEELNHNEEWFESRLTDYSKDVNMITAAINAASQSESPVIQYVHNIFTNIDATAVRENLPVANQMQTKIDEFLKKSNSSNMSTDVFDSILEEVTDILEIDENFNITKSVKSLAFIGKGKPEYYETLQLFKLKFKKLEELRKLAKNNEEIEQIQKRLEQVYEEQGIFLQENAERYYVDEWYDNENLLKQEVVNSKGETVLLKTIKTEYYDQIKEYEEIIESSKEESVIEVHTALLKEARIKLKQLAETEGKEEGSNEYKIAKILQTYNEVRKKFGQSKISNKTFTYFKNLLQVKKEQLQKKIITQDEYDEWIRKNTITKISEQWYEDIKALSTQADEITKEISEFLNDTTIKSDLSGYYGVIKDLSKSYRDEDGIIQGSLVDETRRQTIKKSEEELENINRNIEKLTGLSKNENKKLSDLFLKSKSGMITTQEEIELTELVKKKKEKEAVLLPIKDKVLQLKEVRDKIAKLSNRSLTDEYHKTFENLKNTILATIPSPEIKTDYEISEKTSIIVEESEGEINIIQIDLGKPAQVLYTGKRDNSLLQDIVKNAIAIQKTKESDWFKQNHYSKITYDLENRTWIEEMTPIYVWHHTTPSDESYILNEYPNSKYYKFEHNEESKNKQYQSTPDGIPFPKTTSRLFNNKINELEPHQSEFLEYAREIHYENLIRAGVNKWRYSNFIPTSRLTSLERRVKFVQNFGSNTLAWLRDTFNTQDTDLLEQGISQKGSTFDTVPAYFTSKLSSQEQSKNIPGLLLMSDITSRKRKKFLEIKFFADELVNLTQAPNLKKQLKDVVDTNLYGETSKSTGIKIGNTSLDKIVNFILKITGFKSFALNIISPVQNKGGAFLQQIIETNKRNGMYGKWTWAFAEAEFAKNVKNLMQDHTKFANKSLLGQMMDYFSVMSGTREDALGNKTQWNAVKNITEVLTAPKDVSEFQVQTTQFIAFAKTQKVPGTDISVYDAYEINKEGNIALKQGINFSEEDLNEFILKLQGMQLKINGAYRANQKSMVEKHLLGKAAFFMNQYIVPLYTNQFSLGRYNYAEGRWKKGVQIEGFTKLFSLFKDYKLNYSQWHNDLTENEKADFTRFTKNSMVILTTVALLGLLVGDDDDDKSQAEKLALLYLMRISSEIQTFNIVWGPDEMLRKLKNPFSVVNTLIQSRNAMYYALLSAIGDEDAEYQKKTGTHEKGDSKLMAILYKFMAASPSTLVGLDIDTLYNMQKATYKGGNLR